MGTAVLFVSLRSNKCAIARWRPTAGLRTLVLCLSDRFHRHGPLDRRLTVGLGRGREDPPSHCRPPQAIRALCSPPRSTSRPYGWPSPAISPATRWSRRSPLPTRATMAGWVDPGSGPPTERHIARGLVVVSMVALSLGGDARSVARTRSRIVLAVVSSEGVLGGAAEPQNTAPSARSWSITIACVVQVYQRNSHFAWNSLAHSPLVARCRTGSNKD